MTIDEIKAGIFSNDYNVAFKATQAARKILSRERNPPIGNFNFLQIFRLPPLSVEIKKVLTRYH